MPQERCKDIVGRTAVIVTPVPTRDSGSWQPGTRVRICHTWRGMFELIRIDDQGQECLLTNGYRESYRRSRHVFQLEAIDPSQHDFHSEGAHSYCDRCGTWWGYRDTKPCTP